MRVQMVDLIGSAAETLFLVDFLNRCLSLRSKAYAWLKSLGCIAVIFFVVNFIPRPTAGSWYPTLLMAVISMIYCAIFLCGSIWQKMMTVVVGHSVLLVVNIGTLFVMGRMLDMKFDAIILDRGPIHLKLLLFSKLLFFIITRLILRFRRRDENDLSPMEWASILTILTVTLSIGCVMFDVMWKHEYADLLLMVFAFFIVFINVIIYLLVHRLSAEHHKRTELALLRLQIHEQQSRMEEINAMYREILQIRHDMKKCVGTAAVLIRQGKYSEAERYLSEISGDCLGTIREYAILSSDIVSAVINAKLSQCRREGIEIDVSLSDCLEGLPETDVSLLLSNLFDNAIEACRQIEGKRYLSFRMAQHMGYVRILMSNSADGAAAQMNPDFETTKKDKTKHGFGMKTIQEITDKHRGMCSFQCQKNEFIADIWLQSAAQTAVQARK